MTTFIAVASFPDHGSNWREALQAADAAMYNAKQKGRNRVAVAGPLPGEQAESSGG